jgi:hypothetical protein
MFNMCVSSQTIPGIDYEIQQRGRVDALVKHQAINKLFKNQFV